MNTVALEAATSTNASLAGHLREEWKRRYAFRVMQRAGWSQSGAVACAQASATLLEREMLSAGRAPVWADPEAAADVEMDNAGIESKSPVDPYPNAWEALEMAAVVAGFAELQTHHCEPMNGCPALYIAGGTGVWDPIFDDGDSARLESSCSLEVRWSEGIVTVGNSASGHFAEAFAGHGEDKCAARRWAGVQAAASLGRATVSSKDKLSRDGK